jgi:hypothetical protein
MKKIQETLVKLYVLHGSNRLFPSLRSLHTLWGPLGFTNGDHQEPFAWGILLTT